MSRPHIVLYGHFGVGNLGNDTTLEAMLYNTKKYQPTASITCVCTGAQVIAKRFGIPTLPIDVNEDRNIRWTATARPHKLVRLTTRVVDELDFWVRRTRWFRSVDQFIVVGTGALDDMAVVHPWSAPYDLFKWCRAAKLGGAKVIFLSVGAGPILHPLSRTLMLDALGVADYRSYREVASLEYLRGVGFDTTQDHLYPDLVFSLPLKLASPPAPVSSQIKTVGLGVIGYYGWQHNIKSGEPLYRDYVSKLKQFVDWLLDQGYCIRLLTGDLPTDQGPIDEILKFVRSEGQDHWQERVKAEPIATAEDLYQQLTQTDIVVAARFHNLLAALMVGRPVISTGYHKKNDNLLAEMGLQEYCQHIEHLDVERLIVQFQSLASKLSEASQRIQQKNTQYRQLLDEQFCRILD